MSDIRLPYRPMVELPPPVDGLEQVRGEAGRRRRRRAGVAAAGLTTAAGVAVEEIARLLHVPAGTVKRRLHDGRQRLAGELGKATR